jgi:hypothetical protein
VRENAGVRPQAEHAHEAVVVFGADVDAAAFLKDAQRRRVLDAGPTDDLAPGQRFVCPLHTRQRGFGADAAAPRRLKEAVAEVEAVVVGVVAKAAPAEERAVIEVLDRPAAPPPRVLREDAVAEDRAGGVEVDRAFSDIARDLRIGVEVDEVLRVDIAAREQTHAQAPGREDRRHRRGVFLVLRAA